MQANSFMGQLTEGIAIFLVLEEKLAVGIIKKWCMHHFRGVFWGFEDLSFSQPAEHVPCS